jgi:hypothetical protein
MGSIRAKASSTPMVLARRRQHRAADGAAAHGGQVVISTCARVMSNSVARRWFIDPASTASLICGRRSPSLDDGPPSEFPPIRRSMLG